MKSFKTVLFLIIMTTLLGGCTKAEYDKAKVAGSMREILQNFKDLNQAAAANDFAKAEEGFKNLATLFKELDKVTPNVGTKNEWDKNHGEIIMYTKEGIKACKDQDMDKVKELIGKIMANQKSGHDIFRR